LIKLKGGEAKKAETKTTSATDTTKITLENDAKKSSQLF